MPMLAELNITKIGTWQDRAGEIEWQDSDGAIWASSDIRYCSLAGFVGGHYWDGVVASISPPQYTMATEYGGHCSVSFGSISFNPEAFNVSTLWPPPANFGIALYHTTSTEDAKETLFEGMAHLASFDRETVSYDLYGPDFDAQLLVEAEDYNGDTSPLPIAFGNVQHRAPVRLPDVGIYPTYHKASITGSLAVNIVSTADNGSGKVRFTTSSAHGFTTSDSVTVEMVDFTSTYNATEVVTVIDTTHFDFDAIAYVDDQSGHAFKSGYWRVYDRGIPISGNVTDNGDGTFSLSASPTGEVTISGTGENETLSEIVEWACAFERLNQNFDATHAKSPSPSVSCWADSQGVLIDWLSNVCAFWTHLTYIQSQTLNLVDIDEDNGSRTLDVDGFFPVQYGYAPPIAQIKAAWSTRAPTEDATGKYIKDADHETTVVGAYGYGEEQEITPYHTDQSIINAQLTDIISILHKPRIRVPMPLLGTLPLPGEAITFTDDATVMNLTSSFRCRDITYDFDADEFVVEGEGTLS